MSTADSIIQVQQCIAVSYNSGNSNDINVYIVLSTVDYIKCVKMGWVTAYYLSLVLMHLVCVVYGKVKSLFISFSKLFTEHTTTGRFFAQSATAVETSTPICLKKIQLSIKPSNLARPSTCTTQL